MKICPDCDRCLEEGEHEAPLSITGQCQTCYEVETDAAWWHVVERLEVKNDH